MLSHAVALASGKLTHDRTGGQPTHRKSLCLAASTSSQDKASAMNQLMDILQSGTFWTAVGSIATVLAVVVAVLQGRKKKRLSRSERQRVIGQAKEAASRFDYWIKNYIHHGEKTDTQKLIEWLESDRGYAQVAEDYQVFLKTAELLKEQGYNMQPPPTEAEFLSACKRGLAQESRA